MKKIIYTLNVIACIIICNAQTLTIGTNTFGVSFADTILSPAHKERIYDDLQICVDKPWATNAMVFIKDTDNIKSEIVGTIAYYPNDHVHYHNKIQFPRNITTNNTGSLCLQITRELSDAYTNAFVFAEANSNIVTAAYTFISEISSNNFTNNLLSNQIQDYFLLKSFTSNEMYTIYSDMIIKSWFNNFTYYPPSVLGFYHSPEGPDLTNLWMQIPADYTSKPNSTHITLVQMTAIWHDNKWKLCVWNPPSYEGSR